MKALILAAGCGKRLLPLTDRMPKAMVEVNETPLLIRSLNILSGLGINETGIVIGHMADYIKSAVGDEHRGMTIRYFENKRYMETNNVVSLYKALEFCDDEMLLLESDIYYREEMLRLLIRGKGDCSILVSPFNPDTMDGTVIRVEEDRARELIVKKWQKKGLDYSDKLKTVNMYRFSKNFVVKYLNLIKWYVENMGEESYYEKILGSMIYLQECDCRAISVPEDMWCEIDDTKDLARAKDRFEQ